jgi:hypothetical protein
MSVQKLFPRNVETKTFQDILRTAASLQAKESKKALAPVIYVRLNMLDQVVICLPYIRNVPVRMTG